MLTPLNKQDTVRQSENAYRQWKTTWHENSRRNGVVVKKRGTDQRDCMMMGYKRMGILVALGQSLEENMDTIKAAYGRPGIDVLCVDKAVGLLLDNGIIPRAVAVSDAQVLWSRYGEPWKDKTKNIMLFATSTANPEWAENWQGPVYAAVCKDSIHTEELLKKESGIEVIVPASANVGNALVVLASIFFGYSEINLVGYDFSWRPEKNYYAYSGDEDGIMRYKRNWQLSGYTLGIDDEFTCMSSNLTFAARWLTNFYIATISNLPIKIHNCSRGILADVPKGKLDRRLELWEPQELDENDKRNINSSRARIISVADVQALKKAQAANEVLRADLHCVPKAVMMT